MLGVGDGPSLSVIIPAYESHETLSDCLKSLEAQTLEDFEVILVDSSPSDGCQQIMRAGFEWVDYVRVERRMLPHEARNRGAEMAAGKLIVFTDPDIYATPDWLSALCRAQAKLGGITVGSVRCYGRRWLDLGVHLAKFDQWLPGGQSRRTEIAPTLNMLCPRTIFEQLGGFPGEYMIGDAVFSWRAAEQGIPLHFVPDAEVGHHHIASLNSFLKERYSRGHEFGGIRIRKGGWSRWRAAAHLLVTLLPLRWTRLYLRTFRHAAEAGQLIDAILTSPIILLGHGAWLLGEVLALSSYLRNQQ